MYRCSCGEWMKLSDFPAGYYPSLPPSILYLLPIDHPAIVCLSAALPTRQMSGVKNIQQSFHQPHGL